jgi:hypothetical protein
VIHNYDSHGGPLDHDGFVVKAFSLASCSWQPRSSLRRDSKTQKINLSANAPLNKAELAQVDLFHWQWIRASGDIVPVQGCLRPISSYGSKLGHASEVIP